ncbi:MAG: hypothetical protein PHV23_00420 [Candidatus Gracilibacteria bacterium]|nr:hypothetical protein [Candidatus Gracilibacteria bacterium]
MYFNFIEMHIFYTFGSSLGRKLPPKVVLNFIFFTRDFTTREILLSTCTFLSPACGG